VKIVQISYFDLRTRSLEAKRSSSVKNSTRLLT